MEDNIDYKKLVETHKGIRKAAKAIGIPYSSFWDKLKKQHLNSFSSREFSTLIKHDFPIPGDKPKYFLLTSAQDSSKIHQGFWKNLKAYSDFLEAEIIIGGYTYNKSLFEDHSKASGVYHPDLLPHMVWGRVELGDNILFCGEMNILPTSQKPLTGYETYTGDKWGVFPHAKVQLVSVPTAKEELTKMLMTTGSVTVANYVPKNAGIKASQHHTIGAVVVELCEDKAFFCRHIIADEKGSFYDLDILAEDGKIIPGQTIEAIVYGDIHHEKLNPVVAKTTWGYDVKTSTVVSDANLLDFLKPKYQFFHDLIDFTSRNHHSRNDPHFRFYLHKHTNDSVRKEVEGCAAFLKQTARDFCTSVVVESNHHDALTKWLKEADYKNDPSNAIFYLETQLEYYRYLEKGFSSPPIFEHVLRNSSDLAEHSIVFNSVDESFAVCDGLIECGAHGHLGANGAKASPLQYTKMGKKSVTGHTHSASIIDGAYTVGVSGNLDMGYNKGNSSWSHTHCIIYPNSKRALITMSRGRWFA